MTSTTGTGKGTAQIHLGEHSGSLVNPPDSVKLPRVSWNLFIFQFFKQSIGLILGNNSAKTLIVPNYCTASNKYNHQGNSYKDTFSKSISDQSWYSQIPLGPVFSQYLGI